MKTMTNIAAEAAEHLGLPKNQVKDIADELVNIMVYTLANGEGVQVWGLGSFNLNVIKSCMRPVTPGAKEMRLVPAHVQLSFKSAVPLRRKVRNLPVEE